MLCGRRRLGSGDGDSRRIGGDEEKEEDEQGWERGEEEKKSKWKWYDMIWYDNVRRIIGKKK